MINGATYPQRQSDNLAKAQRGATGINTRNVFCRGRVNIAGLFSAPGREENTEDFVKSIFEN